MERELRQMTDEERRRFYDFVKIIHRQGGDLPPQAEWPEVYALAVYDFHCWRLLRSNVKDRSGIPAQIVIFDLPELCMGARDRHQAESASRVKMVKIQALFLEPHQTYGVSPRIEIELDNDPQTDPQTADELAEAPSASDCRLEAGWMIRDLEEIHFPLVS